MSCMIMENRWTWYGESVQTSQHYVYWWKGGEIFASEVRHEAQFVQTVVYLEIEW